MTQVDPGSKEKDTIAYVIHIPITLRLSVDQWLSTRLAQHTIVYAACLKIGLSNLDQCVLNYFAVKDKHLNVDILP